MGLEAAVIPPDVARGLLRHALAGALSIDDLVLAAFQAILAA